MSITASGIIDKIIYDGRNKNNNFVIFSLRTKESIGRKPEYIKVAGTASDLINEQKFVKVTGEYETNQYGLQLKLKKAEPLEVDEDFLLKENAKRAFLQIMMKMDKIGFKKAINLYEILELKKLTPPDSQESMFISLVKLYNEKKISLPKPYSNPVFFNSYMDEHLGEMMYYEKLMSLSNYIYYNQAVNTREKYPDFSNVLKHPYSLSNIKGISFSTVDKIALSLKDYKKNAPERILAASKFALETASIKDGHLFLTLDQLHHSVVDLIGDLVTKEDLLTYLKSDEEIIIPPDYDNNRVYSSMFYNVEQNIGKDVNRLLSSSNRHQEIIFETADEIKKDKSIILDENDVPLSDEQHEAVIGALKNKFSIITGGPGRGKTTTMKKVVKGFLKSGLSLDDILCVAPTGKAAKRMKESTGFNATTIHKALEYKGDRFGVNRDNPLPYEVIFCDESSMKDVFLTYQLLQSARDDAYIVLLGDVNQIESVGPGNWFKDLIDSKAVPTHYLTIPFRNDAGTLIKAEQVLEGNVKAFWENINDYDDLTYIKINDAIAKNYSGQNHTNVSSDDMIVKITTNKYKEMINKGLDKYEDIQVISPMRAGTSGVHNLNRELSKALNKNAYDYFEGGLSKPFIETKEYNFFKDDKIMITSNDHRNNLMNGETGILLKILPKEKLAVCKIDNRDITLTFNEFISTISPAWVFTAHKSQGSEYKSVIIPLSKSHKIMWNRSLFYTAITRNQENLFLIGDNSVAELAITNKLHNKRNTSTKEVLQEKCKGTYNKDLSDKEETSDNNMNM